MFLPWGGGTCLLAPFQPCCPVCEDPLFFLPPPPPLPPQTHRPTSRRSAVPGSPVSPRGWAWTSRAQGAGMGWPQAGCADLAWVGCPAPGGRDLPMVET